MFNFSNYLSASDALLLAVFFLLILVSCAFLRVRRYHINLYRRNQRDKDELTSILAESEGRVRTGMESSLIRIQENLSSLQTDIAEHLQTGIAEQSERFLSNIDDLRGDLRNVCIESERLSSKLIEVEKLNHSLLKLMTQNGEKLYELENVLMSGQRTLMLEVLEGGILPKIDALLQSSRFQVRGIKQIPELLKEKNNKFTDKTSQKTLKHRLIDKGEPLNILVAGMRHSGSTALFNAIRYIFESSGIEYQSGYSETDEFKKLVIHTDSVRIIKAHEMRDDLVDSADFIFTTKRDLRDTVASASRRNFKLLNQLGGCINYGKYNCMLHMLWNGYSNFEFDFENYIENEVNELERIINFMGLAGVDVEKIAYLIRNIPTNQYEKTLLSEEHQTDKERKLNYTHTLSAEQIRSITSNHLHWLENYGYV